MKLVLPFYSGDAWLAIKNMKWIQELEPHIDCDCILASDDKTDHSEVEKLAKEIFRSTAICKYGRAYLNGVEMNKWPFQQNNAFANVARYMTEQKGNDPWFWLETDCCPLKAGWFQALESEYLAGNKPFGGHWNERTDIFNGVAIYPHNVAMHCEDALMAALVVDEKNDNYQPPWDYYMSSRVKPMLHIMNGVMQHLWNLPDTSTEVSPSFPDWKTVEKWVRPEVYVFHRCKDGSLIDRIREQRNKVAKELKVSMAIPVPDVLVNAQGKDVVHPKSTKKRGKPMPKSIRPAKTS